MILEAFFRYSLFLAVVVTLYSCNPFAPDYKDFEDSLTSQSSTTISGLMNNFAYSYSFKDSFLYKTILDSSFTFKFNNGGTYESWNRDEDLRITNRMFRNFDQLDLTFNNSFNEPGELTNDTTLIISFTLNLFSGTDQNSFIGHAKYSFIRRDENDIKVWKINFWEDLQ